MATENEALVRRWFQEVWCEKRAETIEELFTPETVSHGLGENGSALQGIEGFKAFHAIFIQAFPDMQITVEDMVSSGDMVATRFTGTGTHRGEGMGIPASDQPVTFTGMTFTRWKDGKIVEGWNNVDLSGIFLQIGLMRMAE